MADLNLNELRKVAEAATPGPWLRNPDDDCEVLAENYDPMFPDFPFEFVITDCNGQASISEQDFAHIIAFHPPTALALLDRVAELEAVVRATEAELSTLLGIEKARVAELKAKVARVEALDRRYVDVWDADGVSATELDAALAGGDQ